MSPLDDEAFDKLMRTNHEPRPEPEIDTPPIPHTAMMDTALERLEARGAQVVGVSYGLPIVRFPSGRRMTLTTLGALIPL
jgi:hypothetical protein